MKLTILALRAFSKHAQGSWSFPGQDGVITTKGKNPEGHNLRLPTGFLRKTFSMRKLRHTSTSVNYPICNITAALSTKGGAR